MKSKTYIICYPFVITDYVFEQLEGNPDYVIAYYKRNRSLLSAIKRFVRVHLPKPCPGLWDKSFFTKDFNEILQKIRPDDKVILWAVGNLKEIIILSQEIRSRHISLFLWDPMRKVCHDSQRAMRDYVPQVKKLGIKTYTFDLVDAEKYGMEYVGQVYRKPTSKPDVFPTIGAFFVGTDKQRGPMIDHIAALLEDEDIKCDFYIKPDRHSTIQNYPRLEKFKIDAAMSYPEILEHISKSECLVEIVQPGQNGVTIRTMEALFFGKKFITNNETVKREPFYTPQNIYIIDDSQQPWASIREFLEAPMETIDDKIIESYNLESWIKKL